MPEFILDTSGEIVGTGKPNRHGQPSTFWNHLDSFTQGYVQALFFTDCEHGTRRPDKDETADDIDNPWLPEEHSQLPGDVAFSDFAPQTLARIIADCAKFQETNAALLEAAQELEPGSPGFRYGRNALDDERLGQLFWYARNGHGVAFTDDGNAPCLQALQEASRACCGVDVYLGDNGLIYIMGAE